jgi:uncharacterized protein
VTVPNTPKEKSMLYEITVPQSIKMLKNLKEILVKAAHFAETKKIDTQVLLQSRLAPDQFPLLKQIQIITDTTKLCASRLTGADAPVHDDKETTMTELFNRIDSVIQYLGQFSEKDFANAETKKISQPRWEGKYLTGFEFAIQHALPNTYFHITTAYSILRHNGVEIGKKDYLGAMPYKV